MFCYEGFGGLDGAGGEAGIDFKGSLVCIRVFHWEFIFLSIFSMDLG